MRPKLTYANVVSSLCLFLLLGGGAAYAASHLGKNSVGTKQLKKNAVTTAKIKKEAVTSAKVKNGSLTGTQINASTLGTVPTANTAQTANTAKSVAPSEAWHEIGAPGEPKFQFDWNNVGGSASTAAFYKDHEGIVHLKGLVEGSGAYGRIFDLPPGYRPAAEKYISLVVNCSGVFCTNGVGVATIYGTGFSELGVGGAVTVGASETSLNGIDFRAES